MTSNDYVLKSTSFCTSPPSSVGRRLEGGQHDQSAPTAAAAPSPAADRGGDRHREAGGGYSASSAAAPRRREDGGPAGQGQTQEVGRTTSYSKKKSRRVVRLLSGDLLQKGEAKTGAGRADDSDEEASSAGSTQEGQAGSRDGNKESGVAVSSAGGEGYEQSGACDPFSNADKQEETTAKRDPPYTTRFAPIDGLTANLLDPDDERHEINQDARSEAEKIGVEVNTNQEFRLLNDQVMSAPRRGKEASLSTPHEELEVEHPQREQKFVILFRDGSAAVHSVDVDAVDVHVSPAADGGVYRLSVARARDLIGNYFAQRKGYVGFHFTRFSTDADAAKSSHLEVTPRVAYY